MKQRKLSIAICAVLAGGLSVSVYAATDKVTLCHKDDVTLNVAESAVAAHLAHGDVLGACEAANDVENSTPDTSENDDSEAGSDGDDDSASTSDDEQSACAEAGNATAEPLKTETDVTLADDSSYHVSLVENNGATWTYRVDYTNGKDLSHWALGIESCLESINAYTDENAAYVDEVALGVDGSTGFAGIKWDSQGGTFSFTLNDTYPATLVDVLAKAGTMSNVSTISGPDCNADPVAEEESTDTTDTTTAEVETTTVISVKDENAYGINLVSHEGNTWTYQVDYLSGKDLSHWSLGIESCFDNLTAYTEEGSDIGPDGSSDRFMGIKWQGKGGTFSITLDGDYPVSAVQALVKTGDGYAVGTIAGPTCATAPVEECLLKEAELAETPEEQAVVAEALSENEAQFAALSAEEKLAALIESSVSRPLFYAGVLFLPNVKLALEGGVGRFAILLEIDAEGTFEIVAMSPVMKGSKVETEYTWNDLELNLPVVDVLFAGNLSAFTSDLAVVNFAPLKFGIIKAHLLRKNK